VTPNSSGGGLEMMYAAGRRFIASAMKNIFPPAPTEMGFSPKRSRSEKNL
jgi:hypothetical protein